ncbi:TonB-dependent receptor [Xylophilus ampelinus]|uniref:Iron complex outermembrane receptor protein n=1 Tax=Xylophilus ampelinus TaxID=54067 RepID=A0A318SIN8_9BURK|nr:TonB-dependent siderophore receptor [Xylophilus ampelinus]MCS4510075.1 TonB-dependent siderophore receptor [Xylophilus ampelinus]PYE78221.1 iron complex outermembrane receptor protein [Xylophilus ampelinus]
MHTLVRTALAAAAAAIQAAGAQARAPSAELGTVDVRSVRDGDTLQLQSTSTSASRLGLTLRETPASVEVLTQEVLQLRGARDFNEALRGAAGLSGGGSPASPVTLSTRGFSNILYLYDGVRNSGAGVVNRVQDTWNYERIEVLKGPASVLNGDSAIGGIVNFVTKRPDRNNPANEALLSYGSYGSTRAAVGLGGAVGETGAYRVDYSRHDTRTGTVPRNGEQVDHLTTGLSFDLSTVTRLDLSLDYLRDDNQGYWGTPLVSAAFASQATGVVSTPDGRVIDRRLIRNNYNVLDDENTSETTTVRARLTHRLAPDWTLRNEFTAYQANRVFKNSESAVFVAPDGIDRDQTLITHDQRFVTNRFDASHRGGIGGFENRFVLGGEIGKTDFESQRRFSNGSAATSGRLRVPALLSGSAFFDTDPALTTGDGNRVDTSTSVRTTALFAEDAVKFTPDLTVVGGLRHDRIDVGRNLRDLNFGTITAFGTTYHANSGRLGVVYDLGSGSSAYAQYTNATVPVDTLFLLSAGDAALPLSRGKQIEVGFKQSLAAQRLEWTTALYKIELDNVLSLDPGNPNVTINNGRQSSRGVELSAVWRATPRLSLSGNLAALQAQFDNLVEAGGVSRAGNTPTDTPERVANLFVNYRFSTLPVNLYMGVNHTGASYTDTANLIRMNGYTTADAAVSYRLQKALLSFRIRNLTDRLYAYYGGRAESQVLIAPTRTFEVSAKFDF